MIVDAHAKLNLTLEVLGKRADGYHEIRSIMRTIAMHDTLEIEAAPEIEVCCENSGLDGRANLAYRAAELLREATGNSQGARVTIDKGIPVAAGLGGGSSDAAATLVALNKLWRTGIGTDDLLRLAARLGSDVPFFLFGGTAVASGRGERLSRLDDQPDCPIVLVNPGFAVSTAAVYGAVSDALYSLGEASDQFARLQPGTDPVLWPLVNALQSVTTTQFPEVADILSQLAAGGAVQYMMCGSGPTCFGIFDQQEGALAAVVEAKAQGWQAWHTHFV
jgi:4-diphosphocytidyl-2-C-methyl-D-erythritol kinase